MLIFWTISSLLLSFIHSEEVITFENEEYYLCAVDTWKKTIYLDPTFTTEPKNNSVLIENNNLWNDWLLKDSMEIVVPAVTDKRWEDFGTIYSDSVHFDSVASFSHSVKANYEKTVITNPGQKHKKKDFSSGFNFNTDHWSHSSSHAVDGSLIGVYAYTPSETFWKIHQYKVRFATRVTKNDPTVLTLSPQISPCIILYIYLCANCTMNLTIADSDNYYLQYKDEKWQTIKFEIDKVKNLMLTRGRIDDSESGKWVIDIRKCSKTINNRATLKFDLTPNDTNNRTCQTFPFTQTRVDESIWISINPSETIFGCEVGTLGRKCDVKCEDFLGSKYKRCEKHKICDNSGFQPQCFCAWGFKGQKCNNKCSNGTWGISCQNRCKNCNVCDKVTGKCNTK